MRRRTNFNPQQPPSTSSTESYSELGRILNSLPDFTHAYLKIRNKHREIQSFSLNPEQLLLHRKKVETEIAGKKRRFLVLKPRKLGISTFEQASSFWLCSTRPQFNAITLADNWSNTVEIFGIVKRFLAHIAPETFTQVHATRMGVDFPKMGGAFRIGTAGATSFSRGSDTHKVHGSEVAFWSAPEDINAALQGSITEDAEVTYESTPNGIDNFFYRLWDAAKRQENDFIPVFFPWFHSEEYRTAATKTPWDTLKFLSQQEEALCKAHNLDVEQILWWRAKKRDLGEKMDQEFPSDDISCFLTSFSGAVFTIDQIRDMKARCKQAIHSWEIGRGWQRIWKEPNPSRKYILGADASEGIKGGDYSAAMILDYESCEQVATLHGLWAPAEFARLLARLGSYFGKAMIAVETGGSGHTVLEYLQRELRYPHLYETAKGKVGWSTNIASRPVLVDEMIQAVRENLVWVNDETFLNECLTLDKDGRKIAAAGGCHDDMFFACAIAWQARKKAYTKGYRLAVVPWA